MKELSRELKKYRKALFMRRQIFIKNEKRGTEKLEVVYNVKYKFKTNETKTYVEKKNIFNSKLLNIIIRLENQELRLNNS